MAKVETTWHLAGGHGNDFICADDGFVDKIYCGPDEDRVYADDSQAVSDEIAKNCETVNPRE